VHAVPLATGVFPHTPVAGLQASAVQALPSSQPTTVPPHAPPAHWSPVVHGLPSLHDVPSGTCVWTQLVPEPQLSAVQGLPSSQPVPEPPPVHTPAAHWSPVVHGLPSSHGVPSATATCRHPADGSQVPAVHGFASSHAAGVPAQTPPVQTSPTVQSWPSVQAVPSARAAQAAVQHAPPSHCSAGSATPSPHAGSVQSVRQAPGAVSELFTPSSHSSPHPVSTTPFPQCIIVDTHCPEGSH
jgi:hypothetical protein